MKVRILALLAILSLCLAGTATAAGRGAALTPGGKTLAGPGSATIDPGATVVVVEGVDTKVCATVANQSRGASVLVELVGGGETAAQTVDSGHTTALCKSNTDTVEITCPGESSCSVQWRVDDL